MSTAFTLFPLPFLPLTPPQPAESNSCCLYVYVFRVDQLRLDNLSGCLPVEKTDSLSAAINNL